MPSIVECVPKIIHQIWCGPIQIEDRHVAWSRRWREINPDHHLVLHLSIGSELPDGCQGAWNSIVRFDPMAMSSWPVVEAIRNTAPRSHEHAGISDLKRLEVLYESGGIYIDMDMYPIRPIGDAFNGVRLALSQEYQGIEIGNFIMASTARHPALSRAIVGAFARANAKVIAAKSISLVDDTGPRMVRDEITKFSECVLFPWTVFSPWDPRFKLESPELKEWPACAIAAHEFCTSWQSKPKQKLIASLTGMEATWTNGMRFQRT